MARREGSIKQRTKGSYQLRYYGPPDSKGNSKQINETVKGTLKDAQTVLRDRMTDRTSRVSVSSRGAQADDASDYPVVSGDARLVAFVSRAANLVPGDTNGVPDVFVHYRDTGRTERVTLSTDDREANDESGTFGVALSRDGNCIAFDTYATNLVSDDDNRRMDVFVRDLRR